MSYAPLEGTTSSGLHVNVNVPCEVTFLERRRCVREHNRYDEKQYPMSQDLPLTWLKAWTAASSDGCSPPLPCVDQRLYNQTSKTHLPLRRCKLGLSKAASTKEHSFMNHQHFSLSQADISCLLKQSLHVHKQRENTQGLFSTSHQPLLGKHRQGLLRKLNFVNNECSSFLLFSLVFSLSWHSMVQNIPWVNLGQLAASPPGSCPTLLMQGML